MARGNFPYVAFNRGLVSTSALSRIDVERVRLSAQLMTNWMPKTIGAMFLRPGLGYLGSSASDNAATWIDFIKATDDVALIEITDSLARVWIDDAVLTRVSVTTTISNGDFATSTNWTDNSTGGASLGFSGLGLTMDAVNRGGEAICSRQITVAGGDQNKEHALAMNVTRGPITFRCGSTAGDQDYITESTLQTGRHSLAFTPTGDFHLQFSSDLQIDKVIASIAVESSGAMSLVAPWAAADLPLIRWAQSADVVFVACEGYQQYRIERRGTGRSWSVVKYFTDDGPFDTTRSSKVRLKPTATFGNTTLTADTAFFKSTHVGAIFRIFHGGYKGSFVLGREDTFTEPFRVSGVNVTAAEEDGGNGYDDRNFEFDVSGTWSGTLTVQRSFDDADSGYKDYRTTRTSGTSDTTINGTFANSDIDDNAIIFYRMGFKTGNYTSGVPTIAVDYDGGGDFGICRILSVASSTSAAIEVLKEFTDTSYSDDWAEGLWSDRAGWPTSVAFYEGRLWWAGALHFFGSVSDAFSSYDADVEGDSGPIVRTIGAGPIDTVNWLLPLQRLLLGTASAETSLKSSSFDEPLTPSAIGARDAETYGSAKIAAVKVGKRGVFVHRALKRVFELVYAADVLDYDARELTLLQPDITGTATIKRVGVQRLPDTRLHFVLSDGDVLILTYEAKEDVLCWSRFETSGDVEEVVVLPGTTEDRVYYHVKRTINSATVRYLEKWALESECKGGTLNLQLDSYVSGGAPSTPITTITGLTAHVGEQVAVWADGVDLLDEDGDVKLHTVSAGGAINVETVNEWVVGRTYQARYTSSKLAYAAELGSALTQKKRAANVGVVLGTCHHKGLKMSGRGFSDMDNLPAIKDGAEVAAGTIFSEYDEIMQPVPGAWDTDSRFYLEANAPRVCEVNAAIIHVETNDKG